MKKNNEEKKIVKVYYWKNYDDYRVQIYYNNGYGEAKNMSYGDLIRFCRDNNIIPEKD